MKEDTRTTYRLKYRTLAEALAILHAAQTERTQSRQSKYLAAFSPKARRLALVFKTNVGYTAFFLI
jgi:hypothetical protein